VFHSKFDYIYPVTLDESLPGINTTLCTTWGLRTTKNQNNVFTFTTILFSLSQIAFNDTIIREKLHCLKVTRQKHKNTPEKKPGIDLKVKRAATGKTKISLKRRVYD